MQSGSDIRKRRRAIVKATVMAVAAIALIALYCLADPASGWYPRCPVRMAMGYDCPGCGSQRMLHALLHGDVAAAWKQNPFMMVMVPVMAIAVVGEVWRNRLPRLHRAVTSPLAIAAVVVATLAWTVARNL